MKQTEQPSTYIFVTRSMEETGVDSEAYYSQLSPLQKEFYWRWVKPTAEKKLVGLQKEREGELAAGLEWRTDIDGFLPRLWGRFAGFREPIWVCSLKIQPDLECGDPRAVGRNPSFVMHVLFSVRLNPYTPSFHRFFARCREIGLGKKKQGGYDDMKVLIPKEVLP